MRRRRNPAPVAAAGAAVLAVVLLAGCGEDGADGADEPVETIPSKDAGIDGVTIDLELPDLVADANSATREWVPRVVNESGRRLDDAVLHMRITEPGGDRPDTVVDQSIGECGGVEDMEQEEIDACVEDLRKEPLCSPPGEEPGSHSGLMRESEVHSRSADCRKDVAKGTSEFPVGLAVDDFDGYVDRNKLRDYPTLTVRATLSVKAGVVASADGKLSVAAAPKYDRISFDDVPETVPDDRVDPNGIDWSFTLTNDTDEDFTDARITVQVIRYGFVEISTSDKRCAYTEDLADLRTDIDCDGITVAAGDSLTVDMRLYATGNKQDLKQNCHPKADLCRQTGLAVDLYRTAEDGTYGEVLATGEARTRVKLVD